MTINREQWDNLQFQKTIGKYLDFDSDDGSVSNSSVNDDSDEQSDH